MNKSIFTTIILLLLSCNLSFAQDVITMKDGTDIKAKVLEVSESSIKYKKADNPDGPSYTILADKIGMITYENGTVDMFTAMNTISHTDSTHSYRMKGYEKSIEINAGIPLDKYSKVLFGITMMNGYRFNDFFYAGVGIGYEYFERLYYSSYEYKRGSTSNSYKSYSQESIIRFFGRIKANLTKTALSPYLAGDIGCSIGLNSNTGNNASGLMYEIQFGVDFKLRENIGLYASAGYLSQHVNYTYFNLSSTTKSSITNYSVMAGLVDIKFGVVF